MGFKSIVHEAGCILLIVDTHELSIVIHLKVMIVSMCHNIFCQKWELPPN